MNKEFENLYSYVEEIKLAEKNIAEEQEWLDIATYNFREDSRDIVEKHRPIKEGEIVNVYKYENELLGQAVVGKCFLRIQGSSIEYTYYLYKIKNGKRTVFRFKPAKSASVNPTAFYPFYIRTISDSPIVEDKSVAF